MFRFILVIFRESLNIKKAYVRTQMIKYTKVLRSLAPFFSARKGKLQDRLNQAHNPFLPNLLQFINHRTIQR